MADTQTQLAVLANNLGLTAAQLAQLSTNLQTFKDQSLLALDEDVARAQDGSRITRKGFELLGKALAGKELKFTRAVVGDSEIDGQLTLPTDEEIYELNELINYRFEVSLGKVTHTGGGTAAISFELKNTETTEPIWTREFGIMAEDPDTGDEILYCYRNDGVLSQCMPAGGGKVVWDIIITVYTIVAEAANVTAVIDGSMNFVTPHEFDEHIASTRPHPNTPYLMGGLSTTPALWVTGTDNNLHPMGLSAARDLIFDGVNLDFDTTEIDAALEDFTQRLEDAEKLVKGFDGRTSAVEVNVANLFMQLDAERELGLQPNLLIAEDFASNEFCDMLAIPVVAIDGAELTVQSAAGILPGNFYTLSDGEQYESVQVVGVKRVGVTYTLTLAAAPTNNYGAAILYRTTATIANGEAYGAGEIQARAMTFTETWQGTGANSQVTLALETTQANANSFTVTDNGTFSADGEFTLDA